MIQEEEDIIKMLLNLIKFELKMEGLKVRIWYILKLEWAWATCGGIWKLNSKQFPVHYIAFYSPKHT